MPFNNFTTNDPKDPNGPTGPGGPGGGPRRS